MTLQRHYDTASSLARWVCDNGEVRRALVLVIPCLALVVTACGGRAEVEAPEKFCRAAARYETELERQASKGIEDIERQIELVQQLYDTAPKKVRDDAKTFLDAMRVVETDPSVRNNPKIEEAVDNVNRFAAQGCDVYKSNRTPGAGI